MVAVVAYFTASDELAGSRLLRRLRAGGWDVEWAEDGADGRMVRAARYVEYGAHEDTLAAAEDLATASGAVCACTELEPAADRDGPVAPTRARARGR